MSGFNLTGLGNETFFFLHGGSTATDLNLS